MQLRRLPSIKFKLFFFLLWTKVVVAQYHSFPTPPELVGFRSWYQHQSTFQIKLTIDSKKNIASLKLHSPGSDQVKVSRSPKFENSTWREIKTTTRWSLDGENQNLDTDLRTLYVVFKTYDPISRKHLISPILHDTLDLKRQEKKIVRTPSGYMDWSEMNLLVVLKEKNRPTTSSKYRLNELQKNAEEKGINLTFQTLKKLPILPNYLIENYLFTHPKKKNPIKYFLNQEKLVKIYYPSLEEITIEKKIPFFQDPQSRSLSLYQYLKPDFVKPKFNRSSQPYSDPISTLVIDTRGFNFHPTLFIRIVDQKNTVIFNSAYLKSSQVPFIRYFRHLDKQKLPRNTLITTAYSIDQKKASIKILNKYAETILNHPSNLTQIAQGNFYLLVD